MGVDSMLQEGQRYYFKTNDGSEVCGTMYRILTNGRRHKMPRLWRIKGMLQM